MSDNIIVGFSRPKAKFVPFADAIMWADKSDFSHVYIRFHSNSADRDLVYQASGMKVNFIGWILFQQAEVAVHEFSIPVTAETKTKVIQFAIDNCGIEYALGQALGIGLVKAAALFGKKIANPVSSSGYFCSKMVAIILREYFNAPFTDEEIAVMTPTDCYDYLNIFMQHVPAC